MSIESVNGPAGSHEIQGGSEVGKSGPSTKAGKVTFSNMKQWKEQDAKGFKMFMDAAAMEMCRKEERSNERMKKAWRGQGN